MTNENKQAGAVPQLLPCPFCGGRPHLRGVYQRSVECYDCGVFAGFITDAEAIAVWNTRAAERERDELAKQNERLHGRIIELESTIGLGDKYVAQLRADLAASQARKCIGCDSEGAPVGAHVEKCPAYSEEGNALAFACDKLKIELREARAKAIEECARAVEQRRDMWAHYDEPTSYSRNSEDECNDIVDAIRALATTSPGEEKP